MRKLIIILIIGIVVTVAGFGLFKSSGNSENHDYQYSKIVRGDIQNTITSTGTINAVSTVEIGTQVSGIIDKIYVDYNDKVHSGQLLAVLDTFLLKTSLLDAQANVEKAKAQLEQIMAEQKRNQELFRKKLISEAEFLPYEVNLKTQKANLKSSEIALKRAELNFDYAFIRSPINGTVIEKNVEEGQTVAASLQAPTLFIIAEDLSKMEIHAQVDESDIGAIKKEQNVIFDVLAYPDKMFNGTVKQIRLQPNTTQNVVNYTVIIKAANDEYLLLPGMTATVNFIVEERNNILLVPNTALRFQPSQDEMMAFFQKQKKRFETMPDSVKEKIPIGKNPAMLHEPGQGIPKDRSRVWYFDKDSNLAMAPIRTGATDGKVTEIIASRDLKEGMKVITGLNNKNNNKRNSNNEQRGFRGPRPF